MSSGHRSSAGRDPLLLGLPIDVTDWRSARPVPGKLFLVGDPKQSIYRFRRADIALYEEVKVPPHRYGRRAAAPHRQFPGAPSLQAFVNELSRAQMPSGGTAGRPAM